MLARQPAPGTARRVSDTVRRARRVASGRDRRTDVRRSRKHPSDPRQAARQPGRLPDEGRARSRALRGQGAEPQEPRPPVLADQPRPPRTAGPLRIESAIDRVHDVEYTLTDTVSEALLLEATLIKRHQPRFNVRLKDDKSYPFIKVTLGDDFPRIERTRKLPAGRQPLLRAVRVGEQRRRGDEPHPAAVPVPDLHHRDQGGRARAAAARACCTTSSAARAPASRPSTRTTTAPTSTR